MQYTKEQTEDFMKRNKPFGKAYDALCKKYQCELVPIPQYTRGPHGVWATAIDLNIGDTKYKPIESPIAEMMT